MTAAVNSDGRRPGRRKEEVFRANFVRFFPGILA
jgi:hypothetical protein